MKKFFYLFLFINFHCFAQKNDHVYFSDALTKIKQNDLAGAVSDLSNALDINPLMFEAYVKRANLYEKLRDFGSAIMDLDKL